MPLTGLNVMARGRYPARRPTELVGLRDIVAPSAEHGGAVRWSGHAAQCAPRVSGTETLAVIGATTGVVGALTGVLSLAWQIAVHRGSGRRVKVHSTYTIPVWNALDGSPDFRDDDMVAIGIQHTGGSSVTVTNYGVSVKPKPWSKRGGRNLFVTAPPTWGARVGSVLQPGGQPLDFLVPVQDLRRLSVEQRIPFRRMRGWVDLGDGRRVYSDNHVPLK